MSEIIATCPNAETTKDPDRGRPLMQRFAVRMRRRETPFYDRAYRFAKPVKHLEMPAFRPLFRLSFYERMFRRSTLCNLWRIVYQEPIDEHNSSPGKHRSDPEPKSSLRSLFIDGDVFIATGSTIAKGVTIGRSAIVSADSVVTRNVPPYTIVAGNSARVTWRFPRPSKKS